ncbi:hypothetical protein ACE1SV_34870 [Streptomyces sp. E-15]
MRYVEIVGTEGGFYLDPRAYMDELPRLCAALPPGARSFATDPGHYDIAGATHCVKDLGLAGIHFATDGSGGLLLDFAPNRFKHDSGLRISYSGVTHFSVDTDSLSINPVLLDEILPEEGGGCLHEIALINASITVRCADLQAVWAEQSATAPRGT